MSARASQAVRWVRALMLACVALTSGSLAHVMADGVMPDFMGATAVLAATTAGAAFFLGRPATTTRIVVLLLAAQTFVHGALSVAAGHRRAEHDAVAHTIRPDVATAQGHDHPVPLLVGHQSRPVVDQGPTLDSMMSHVWEHLGEQDLRMVLAHLVATIALGLWLSVGERALFTVLALLAAPIVDLGRRLALLRSAGLVGPLALPRVPFSRVDRHQVVAPDSVLVSHVVVRRGPPLSLAA